MNKTIVLVLVLVLILTTGVAKSDFTFGEPINLGPNINTSSGEGGNGLSISADELSIYFESDRSGGYGTADLWVATRATKNDDWTESINLGSVVNSSAQDNSPSISADGLSLYFSSNRSGTVGNMDLWVAMRETTADDWGTPSNLGPIVNSSNADYMSHISADGLSLYFSSERSGGLGNRDLWVSTRATTNDEWGEPVNLGSNVNSSSNERRMWISSDGLMLLLQSDRPKGSGAVDIYMTTRATTNDDWTEPVNIGPPVNVSIISDVSPVVSSDGRTLYFASYARIGNFGQWDIWQATIIPMVDLNGDGIVDAADMCIVVDNWGTDNKLCDVGPMPWGDGVVDVEDLIVIAGHLFEVYPSAETVDVNEADNGGQVELELGKLLVVTLESNPSTGYQWELVENNDSVLKQFGQTEYKSSDTGVSPRVGAGGWEIFRFKAVSAGQTTLELVYHRPWEDAEPLKTFSIQVMVP
jgi:predicted secreted protein